ncbi:UDP-glucose/GDP-mannose dehydrogenase family protein [Frisingicoccus caecimuris]|uniref:UDP-glucose 6-dehydrogenase n=1 Tax=Frisingicoccus caecimuris TaxID=1796636 RepID=A0A4R2L8M0_9FIRM|nr:UDP-glucose/GDP-mannose dehydrogenase family protein [Frisingicoccus caecimuris]MCR1919403.1 UDP-glucose/GDP-mannose dehydrogenase family protein [Frisingicoccus caecimuris]TCO83979.1 UDPglucose 6-dehydrogenase [Frisingicoccus caecimuris]
MKIAVAGTGYVGLVTGVCLASKGHQVTCVDVDEKKVEIMRQGISPIYEPGLDELMQQNMLRLTFTVDYESAYKDAQVIFIGVGTPEKKDGSANLSYVYKVVEQIAESVERECVVVVKSTVPIGTNDKIETYMIEHLKNNVRVHIASNPEFLAQGTAVHDTLHASRIVIGAESDYAKTVLEKVYENFEAPKVITNRRSAEMIKYASNDFLALKISYVNEIANLCEIVGADIEDVTRGMGFDARIGDKFLNSGIGYGGSCFPKDTKALSWLASFNDNEIKTIKAAIEVNENQKFKLIKKARKYYEDFSGLTVAVLGLTFKPGTDDLREAPSLVNIPIMLEDGARVKAWDPVGVQNYKKIYPEEIEYCDSIQETLENADICFIFTEWPEVKQLDVMVYKALMRHPIILDGRNCYKLDAFANSGIIYDSIGRETIGW